MAVEFMGDVGLTVHGAARRERHDLTVERAGNGILDPQPHSANLLNEEFTAAGGTLVVRKNVRDSTADQSVDQK
jgi:hypothetical protein